MSYQLPIELETRRARMELRAFSQNEIQVQTAVTWAARACAAMELGLPSEDYAHEAVEHAALSGNDLLLRDIRAAFQARKITY